jgi:hypothetical protein
MTTCRSQEPLRCHAGSLWKPSAAQPKTDLYETKTHAGDDSIRKAACGSPCLHIWREGEDEVLLPQ